MKRSGFSKPGQPLARKATMRTAIKTEPKRRTRKCAVSSCRAPFEPRSMTHKVCSPECSETHIAAEKARKERSERQAGLMKLKPRTYWVAQAQTAFNAFIRERDKDLPCICCASFKASGESALHGGGWDAGHYISRGHASHLRFDERNVHKQRKGCNKPGGSSRAKYRKGLVERIGLESVLALEALEYEEPGRGETVEELKAIKVLYVAKLRQLRFI